MRYCTRNTGGKEDKRNSAHQREAEFKEMQPRQIDQNQCKRARNSSKYADSDNYARAENEQHMV